MTDIDSLPRDRAPVAKTVSQFHKNADTDGSTKAIHHTIGPGPSQAAAGNHTHDGGQSALIDPASIPVTPFVPVPWIDVTAFFNAWVNYGTFANAGYRKVNDEVILRGLVKNGTLATGATGDIFVLPVGYRPAYQIIFIVPVNAGVARLDVYTTGNVRAMSHIVTGGTNAFLSLDQVRFSTTA